MRQLTAKECRPFFDAVEEKALELGAPVTTAVVGPEGHVIAVERMPGAGFITADTAIAKAWTISAFRTMSPRFPNGLVIQKWFQQRNPHFLINAAVLSNGRAAASGGMAPIFDGDDMNRLLRDQRRHLGPGRGNGTLRAGTGGMVSRARERHHPAGYPRAHSRGL